MRVPVVKEMDLPQEPADTDAFAVVTPPPPDTIKRCPAPKPPSSSRDA